MKAGFIALSLAALGAVNAAPLMKRQEANMTDIDVTILQYALTLEHLEDTFYRQALAKFDQNAFSKAGFPNVRSKIAQIASHEKAHVAFLTTALSAGGANATAECTYDFGLTDVKTFLATASVLEGVGVSAYLGAANLITNPDYLTAAGSILTVESRHSSYIRNTVGESPFPSAFDIPLDFNQVYSLAAPFIKTCPSTNPALPVKAFPGLTATTESPKSGGMVKLVPTNSSSIDGQGQLYASFIGYPTSAFGVYNKESMEVMIPTGIEGQTYIVLTTNNATVTDDNTVAGPALLEVMAA